MMLGDSKTIEPANNWPAQTRAAISAAAGHDFQYFVGATGNHSAEDLAGTLPTYLSHAPVGNYPYALVDIGVVDIREGLGEGQFKAAVTDILDQIHSYDPNTLVYLARPWSRGFDSQSNVVAGWIADVIATREFARAGPDERVWAKGDDDGATMFPDGTHPGAAGNAEMVSQWLAALGF